MRAHLLAGLVLVASSLAACKQGDLAPLEPLPPVENCALADSLVTPAITSAQVGRMVNGTFQALAPNAEVEVMPYSTDDWTADGTFVTAVALRLVPPANVTEATLCGAIGYPSDTFSNYVFHRVGAYLVADPVLLTTPWPEQKTEVLAPSAFFPLDARTFRADATASQVTLVDREGLFSQP